MTMNDSANIASEIPARPGEEQIRRLLEAVSDPEIPVLTISDLGVLRGIRVGDDLIEVLITPTYSGCPAMDMIALNIKLAMQAHGISNVKITQVLSPAWTTDWISEEGRNKLREYGIAPPNPRGHLSIACPNCGSTGTELLSEFGSTACKSLYRCTDCLEPFDYFKCH